MNDIIFWTVVAWSALCLIVYAAVLRPGVAGFVLYLVWVLLWNLVAVFLFQPGIIFG